MKVTDQNPKEFAIGRRNPNLEGASEDLEQRLPSCVNKHLYNTRSQKTQILRTAAHDLRNPISGILFASEYLLESLLDGCDEEHAAVLRSIQSSSQLLLHLIDDMVEIGAIESETGQFRGEPTDLLSLVKQDLILNRLVAERKGILLDLAADEATPLVLIEPPKLYQVIDNLVTNAIKFSYWDHRIEIRVTAQCDRAVLSVRHEGLDIADEELTTALSPFQKNRTKAGANTDSFGLGLTMVTRIVEGHGGEVRIKSEEGKGSTFTVSLPIAANAKSAPSQRGARRPAAKGSTKTKPAREHGYAAP
jgi:signal transduction histidine kinase